MAATALMALPAILQGGLSIMGASQQADALRQQGQFATQQAAANSQIGEMQATDAIRRGEKDASKYQTQVKTLIGKQRAGLAAQGIDVNSGSAAEVQEDTAAIGALDALTIRNNAKLEAFGYKIAANNATLQGGMANLSAVNQANSTVLSGGISALGHFGSAAYTISQGFPSESTSIPSGTKMSGQSYFDPRGYA